MADNSRVPKTISEFNSYLTTTDNFLQADSDDGSGTNWKRLGLTDPNQSDWNKKRKDWDKLYKLHQNKDTKTKTVNDNVKKFMKDFKPFSQKILDKIAVSDNAAKQDAIIFNVVLSGTQKKPEHKHTIITDNCVISVVNVGGGVFKLSVRSTHDSKRASLAPGADSIQIAYKMGDPAPKNADDGTNKEVITKASITKNIGAVNIGTRFYLYVRWYNTKNPDIASGWSKVYAFTVGE